MTAEELFALYANRLVGLAHAFTHDRDRAEDVAAETWYRLLRAAPSFASERQAWVWLGKAARFAAFDEYRSRTRVPTVNIDDVAFLLPASDSPERAYLLRERAEEAASLLRKLPLRDAAALMRAAEGASSGEVAAAINVGEGMALFKTFRARARIAALHHAAAGGAE